MAQGKTVLMASDREPRRAELGLVDGLDLHAEYFMHRTGGDFFDALRIGTRVAFLLSDIAGRRAQSSPIAAVAQQVFRSTATELFGAGDVNLMEGTEMLVRAVNLAIMGPQRTIHFAPTMIGCYDLQLGVLAYINAGGQTALLRDSDGTRPLPNVSMPLGLFTHLMYDASMQAFEPGSTLLVVTKGVTESMHGTTPFGAERLTALLATSKSTSASAIARETLKAASQFEQRRWDRLAFWKTKMREDLTALVMVRSR